jgi:hypothetical protein
LTSNENQDQKLNKKLRTRIRSGGPELEAGQGVQEDHDRRLDKEWSIRIRGWTRSG